MMIKYTGNLRNGRGNLTFLHKLFGMCLWQHLSGKCWVKNNQLNLISNKWDCDLLQALCKEFLVKQFKLGSKLFSNNSVLNCNKLGSFCSTVINKYLAHGTYNHLSATKDGIIYITMNCWKRLSLCGRIVFFVMIVLTLICICWYMVN